MTSNNELLKLCLDYDLLIGSTSISNEGVEIELVVSNAGFKIIYKKLHTKVSISVSPNWHNIGIIKLWEKSKIDEVCKKLSEITVSWNDIVNSCSYLTTKHT